MAESIALGLRLGTAAEHANFTGIEGEITINETEKRAVVHDGTTKGGFPMARLDETGYSLGKSSDGTKLQLKNMAGMVLSETDAPAGGGLTGSKITAAMPITKGDVVVYGMHAVDLDTEEFIEGYMPFQDCHIIYQTGPILVATANIAQGETSESVSFSEKFPIAKIQEMSLTVGQPVFFRCLPDAMTYTPIFFAYIFEEFKTMYPEDFGNMEYDSSTCITQGALSVYPEFEAAFFGEAKYYTLLGYAVSETEVLLTTDHPVFSNTLLGLGETSTYALFDENGRSIVDTYATKSEAGGSYTLPAATSSTLGGVKIGSNITNSSGTISVSKSNVTNALGYTPVKTVNGTSPDSNGNVTINVSGGSSADSLKSTGGTFNGTTVFKAASGSTPAVVGSAYPVESGKVVVFGNSDTLYGSGAGAGLEVSGDSVLASVTSSDGKSFGVNVSSSMASMFAMSGSNYNMLYLSPTASVPATLKGNLVVSVNGVKADANGNVEVGGGTEITYGTTDLTAGSSALATGSVYLVYE